MGGLHQPFLWSQTIIKVQRHGEHNVRGAALWVQPGIHLLGQILGPVGPVLPLPLLLELHQGGHHHPAPSQGLFTPSPAGQAGSCLQDADRDSDTPNRRIRLKSPSIPRERTRDELIDSIVHTRTREHRAMPGFKSATDFDERRSLRVDCDKVFNGIIIGNGETICNITYLKNIGVTHVLNTATEHVVVNPAKYPAYDIQYYGFHVDDLPD